MCGIAGIASNNHQSSSLDELRAMTREIAHRGPDDEGYCLWQGAASSFVSFSGADTPSSLGLVPLPEQVKGSLQVSMSHRRLSIIDLSTAGHQPMLSPCGKVAITYNGEVYNYCEIREQLEQQFQVQFMSHSDTEVLLHAYLQWGVECFKHFNGMFALVIGDFRDSQAPQMVFARDPFGIKPLYYHRRDGVLAFCSESKGLLQCSHVSRSVRESAAVSFLLTGESEFADQTTFFEDIQEFPPASYGVILLDHSDKWSITRYWSPVLAQEGEKSMSVASGVLQGLLEHSVNLHMRSDVPVACAVSGGVDSSGLLGIMAHSLPAEMKIHGFTYIADCHIKSEEKWADIAVSSAKVIHHKIRVDSSQFSEDLDQVIYTQDFPFAGTSIYAQNKIFQSVAASGIKVTLDGQGPDELFGGYGDAIHARLRDLIRSHKYHAAMQFALGHYRPLAAIAHFAYCAIPGAHRLNAWWKSRRCPHNNVITDCVRAKRTQKALPISFRKMLKRSLLTDSIPSLLRFEDRNSMAYSVESRVPYLTKSIAECSFGFDDSLFVTPAQTKAVLREALKSHLPGAIYQRKDKIGFETPEADWLNSSWPWIEKQFCDEPVGIENFINLIALKGNLLAIKSGRMAYDPLVWRCLCLIAWARLFRVVFPLPVK